MKHLFTLTTLFGVSTLFVIQSPAQNCPPLNPSNDGTGIATTLIMSEINPGDYIELYNTTGADIALSGVPHQLCSPFNYAALSSLASGVVVPANGYAIVPWPGNFSDTDAGGEVILYRSGSFSTSTDIVDYVCWGVIPHASRKSQAEAVGKWQSASPCATAISGGSIHRLFITDGTTAASYNTTLAPSSGCGPDLCAGVSCDDGNVCNGTETCDSLTGNCVAGTALVCNDNDACTTDGCNASTGCTFTNITCNDGDPCTTDGCNPSTGCTTSAVICNDNDACTRDSCINGSCSFIALCNDGDICTNDSCASGQCFFNVIPGCNDPCEVLNCNDSDACTTDTCTNGACSNTSIVCNDADACTTDSCNTLTGCTTSPVVCDDGDACTTDDCDALTGCGATPIICDDGDACTTDGCNPTTGCTASAVACDDGDTCTVNSCDPLNGCTFTPITGCDMNDVQEYEPKQIQVYPNPFTDKLNFELSISSASRVRLELFNVEGQRLAILYDDFLGNNEVKTLEYRPVQSASVIIYRLRTEKENYYGKAIMTK